MMLYLDPSGAVRPCCRNHVALGNIRRTRLPDIWWGRNRALLEERIAARDFSLGCTGCSAEMDAEGPALAYPSTFDIYASDLASHRDDRWPLRMEFNLSNACNLQCVQCNGLLSSAIRIHREHLPALPMAYDDKFFDDLEAFIPHLVDAQFAGGEPFLSRATQRVWDLVRTLNPGLHCTAVTNATQWDGRIERLVEDLNMTFVFSIDSVSKDSYESIRVGADFDVVMANVDRYRAAASSKGLFCGVNYCLMVQNHSGLADVLRWAEERGMRVNVSVVRDPASCSLAAAPDDLIGSALRLYESQNDSVVRDLSLNLPVWNGELRRLRAWLEAGEDERSDLYGNRHYVTERRHTVVARGLAARTQGEFSASIGGRKVAQIRLDNDDRITSVDAGFTELVGSDAENILGRRPGEAIPILIEERFGHPPTTIVLFTQEEIQELDVTVGVHHLRVLAMPATDGPDGGTVVQIVEIHPHEVGRPFVDVTELT